MSTECQAPVKVLIRSAPCPSRRLQLATAQRERAARTPGRPVSLLFFDFSNRRDQALRLMQPWKFGLFFSTSGTGMFTSGP